MISQMVGVCVTRKPWLLVTEYMAHKDLATVLALLAKAGKPLRVHELLYFAEQICDGLVYLEKVIVNGNIVICQ